MHALTDLFLQRRGYTPQFLQEINDPRHPKLQNVDKLSQILKGVHDRQDKIVIMPDFDTDGISAGTVGFAGLAQMGFNVALYSPIPSHGYGIQISDVKTVQQLWPDVKYLITCDVGITCYEAFKYASTQNIHVLITDHHEEQKNKPQPLINDVIVNPCQLSETYPLRNICGAHVFYQVLMNYAQMYCDMATINLIDKLYVFAGIGTIGDMMDMVKENRELVKKTISFLKALYEATDLNSMFPANASFTYKRAFIGLKILMLNLHEHKKLRSVDDIDEKWLGWTLVPTYNSAKRMNLPMEHVFGIFFGQNAQIQSQYANQLISGNENRKRLTNQYLEELHHEQSLNQQPWAPFIYVIDAPGGFLGLIANQLMRESNLPTFVINKTTLAGSGRSLSYFPVITALSGTEFRVAGHEEAFGIGFKDLMQINRFYDYLVKYILPLAEEASKKAPTHDYDLKLVSRGINQSDADANINIGDDKDFYHDTTLLKPFGMSFPEPKINIEINPQASRIFTMGDHNQHLKIITPENLQLISWNNGQLIDKIKTKEKIEFSGDFSINKFRNQESLQMIGDVENE